ncbi:hypothetical protein N0V86_002564 [Didymella sp. IMI 355093]|nr:hypothetical protein N0V86_002564 [Didymella sp. IMI 355093]
MVKPHQLSVTLTEAFVATCSPDELLGQVIQTLCPRYNIDAPHLLALRQLLSSTIVAPRKPPTLKRTRPDKRIGEIGSIYDTPRRSPYGPNGPPVSANQSFYFHHQDIEFERLLPRVDRTRYVWRNESASQSDSDGEEIPDSQESMQSQVSTIETPATALTTSVTRASTNSDEKAAAKAHPQAQQLCSTFTQGLTSSDEQLSVPKSSPKTPRKDASASSQKSQRSSVPTITITTPRSTERMVTSEHKETTLPSPPLRAADVAMELLDSQETHSVPPPPYSASSFYMPQCSDTQDTVNSTQLSEVFSPPDDFMNYTPPTQEETQQEALSQAEMSGSDPSSTAIKMGANASAPPPRHPPRALPSSSPVSSPLLGKRSRRESEVTDDAPSLKRSKSQEGT